MKKITIKKYPEKSSILEIICLYLHKIFHERKILVQKSGKLVSYSFSSSSQIILFSFILVFIIWSLFTTKIYLENINIIQSKDIQIENSKIQFEKLISDIGVYRNNLSELNKKLELSHNNVIELISKNNKLTSKEKNDLLKKRTLLTSEFEYVNNSFNKFITKIKWDNNFQKDNINSKNTKMELERNIALNENIFLKKKNDIIEKSLSDMVLLQNNLLDKIIVLADGKLKSIESVLNKIGGVSYSIDLKDNSKLINKLSLSGINGVGGKYIPLKNITLNDKNLDSKFKSINNKINLWEGLSMVKSMLPLGAPVKKMRITSPFGVRSDPFLKTPAMHTGIDFAGKHGTPLYSTSAGKVIYAGKRGDYGLAVEVDHGLGFSTLYGHLSKVSVNKGDIIEEGAKVGLAGSTGRSTGTHLHYEIRYNSRPLNPYSFLHIENNS